MKRLWIYPVRLVDGLVDRLVALAGAVGFSQAPGFINHYVQRLGGHVAEAQHNVATWQAIADKSTAGDLHALITLYRGSDKGEVLEAGRKCAADVLRLEDLSNALKVITDSPAWERAIVFLRHLDADIARAAAHSFVPTIPLNLEGLCYALVGLVLGLCLYGGIKQCVRAAFRAARRARERRQGAFAPAVTPQIKLNAEDGDDADG